MRKKPRALERAVVVAVGGGDNDPGGTYYLQQ